MLQREEMVTQKLLHIRKQWAMILPTLRKQWYDMDSFYQNIKFLHDAGYIKKKHKKRLGGKLLHFQKMKQIREKLINKYLKCNCLLISILYS